MKLIISNVSGVPIYEQIKQQIKAAILSGELQAEETLPSLRTLAKDNIVPFFLDSNTVVINSRNFTLQFSKLMIMGGK